MLLAVLVCGGVLVLLSEAAGSHSGGGVPSSDSFAGARAARPTVPRAPGPIAPGVDRFRSFETGVNPGSGVQFVSREVGFALSGESDAEIDEHLSAGAGGTMLAWPSPAVLVSRDGGGSFTQSLSVPDGFWGLDFSGPKHGWAVGVNRLYRTVDGGTGWVLADEPSRPLVRVAFADSTSGFGLTVNGRVVTTSDGGSHWRQTAWDGRGSAICTTNPRRAIMADESGGLWLTHDSGARWTRVAAGFAHVEQFGWWWPELSCRGANAVESAYAFCEAACEGVDSHIRQTVDGGLSWKQILRPDAGPFSLSKARLGTYGAVLGGTVVLGGGGICLLGAESASVLIRCLPSGLGHNANAPRLSLPHVAETAVLGGDFISANVGWVLIADSTAADTPRQARETTEVWTTENRGRTWRASYVGPVHAG